MEQRIQSSTQALSRVGRVLSRHREDSSVDTPIQAPLRVMTEEQVLQWMWKKPDDSIISKLISSVGSTFPIISKDFKAIERQHHNYFTNKSQFPKNINLRQSLMLDLRQCLISAHKMKETAYKTKMSNAVSKSKENGMKEKQPIETSLYVQSPK